MYVCVTILGFFREEYHCRPGNPRIFLSKIIDPNVHTQFTHTLESTHIVRSSPYTNSFFSQVMDDRNTYVSLYPINVIHLEEDPLLR